MHFPLQDVKRKLLQVIYTPLPAFVYRFNTCLETTFLSFFSSRHFATLWNLPALYLKSVLDAVCLKNTGNSLLQRGNRSGTPRGIFGANSMWRNSAFEIRFQISIFRENRCFRCVFDYSTPHNHFYEKQVLIIPRIRFRITIPGVFGAMNGTGGKSVCVRVVSRPLTTGRNIPLRLQFAKVWVGRRQLAISKAAFVLT